MMFIQKYIYKYAYRYAGKCQKKNFNIYIGKYIKKHIKYRKKNFEYQLLIVLIDNDNDKKFEKGVKELSIENKKFSEYLYQKNKEIYEEKKNNYSYRLINDKSHVENLVEGSKDYVNISEDELTKDIVIFSVEMQEMFKKSDLVAKTKIQEHWFMRLPIYMLCMSMIYILKMYEEYYENYMKKIIITLVYILSIYMVSIRFHQSVLAETKKLSSEIYSKKKNELYKNMCKQN